MSRHLDPEKVSILVLDFEKPEESKVLLESLKKFANFNKEIVFLTNGTSCPDYCYEFYKEGLIDTLIIKRDGAGGGFGQTILFRYCETNWAILAQCDQELITEINQNNIDYWKFLLKNGYHSCDLAGDQSNRKVWSDRAHFINVDFFNSLGDFPNGGPGLDNIPWNEEFIQNKFKENNYKIFHVTDRLYFDDRGKWSIRQAGDGLYKHRCDLKIITVLRKPTYRTEVYPPLNDSEWGLMLSGNWPKEGKIPEKWLNHSFNCFGD